MTVRVPGMRRVREAARLVRSRFVSHGVVLGYHRVSDDAADPFDLNVRPANFAAHLEVLRRTCRPRPLAELASGVAETKVPPGVVAVTFDDGYSDALSIVKPLLERFEVPATVFVVAGNLGGEFWWDALDRQKGAAAGATPLHRSLRPAELRNLAQGGLVDIGAHTLSHPRLDALGADAVREEIVGSKRVLEDLVEHPIEAFSYPHGCATSTAMSAVREAGFRHACGSRPDVVWRGSDAFNLPRLWVADCDGPTFGRWLRRWLTQ